MKKYMLKRILFSIFSLLVVVMVVMLLVYTAINRNVIFQQDDVWNKRSNNDKAMYEYAQYQKYGYLEYVDYSSFVKLKYMELYGSDYETQQDFITDRTCIQKEDYKDNPSVKEFAQKYSAQGYKIKYLAPAKFKSGKLKTGGSAYLVAVHELPVTSRLLNYIKGFFTVETTNSVKDETLTDRYIRFEKDHTPNSLRWWDRVRCISICCTLTAASPSSTRTSST
jgi:oligopeptide transport system permease protein